MCIENSESKAARKILISIVSGQIIPNLLPVNELNPEFCLLVASNKMGKKAEQIRAAFINAGFDKEKIIIVRQVDEYKITDIAEKTKTALLEIKEKYFNNGEEPEYIFNFTGGTKHMSIGLYEMAFKYFEGKNVKLFYSLTPDKKNNIVKYQMFSPGEDIKEYVYSKNIFIGLYLNALSSIDIKDSSPLKSAEETAKLYKNREKIVNHSFIRALREVYNGSFKKEHKNEFKTIKRRFCINNEEHIKILNIPQSNNFTAEEIREYFKEWEFIPKERDIISKEEVDYLTGGWLEEYVYNSIPVKEEYKVLSAVIQNDPNDENDKNEYDVLVMYNNIFYIIECKTIFGRDLAENTAFKSSALKQKFGNEDCACIVFPHLAAADRQKVEQYFRNKGEKEKVKVCTPEELLTNIFSNKEEQR